jgi:hypothetical protein
MEKKSRHQIYYKKNKKRWKEIYGPRCRGDKHKERRKGYAIKRRHGIGIEEYNLMFINQSGQCLICKKHQSEFKRALAVDHCHTTNKIRGLLCHKCNLILGYAHDDVEILKSAIEYLKSQRQ